MDVLKVGRCFSGWKRFVGRAVPIMSVGVYLVLVGPWFIEFALAPVVHTVNRCPLHKACVLPSCAIVTFVMLIDHRDTKSPIYDSSIVGDRPALLCCFDAIV